MKQTCTLILAFAVAIAAAADGLREKSNGKFGYPNTIPAKKPAVTLSMESRTGKTPASHIASAVSYDNVYNDDGTLEIPFTLAPTQEDVDRMNIINVDLDERTWSYESTEKALFYRYSTKLDADDYAVIPINVTDADKLFRFSVSARCQNGYFGESFELCAGEEAKSEKLIPVFKSGMIYNEDYLPFEAFFAAKEAGTYYVAIHIVSPKNCMRFYVQNIRVEQTSMSVNVPAECTGIVATAAPEGALGATVTFTMPANSADGALLDSNSPITVKIVSSVETKEVTAAPGAEMSVDIATQQGDNTIELIPSDSHGEGLHSTVNLFTGPDIPAAPEVSAKVSADNMTMALTMHVSSTGRNGGYVNPETVEYSLHTYVEEDYYGSWELLENIGSVSTYNYTLPEGTAQQVVNLGVTASNAQGDNKTVISVSEVMGTPHSLPATEVFAEKKFTYSPVVLENPTDEYLAEYAIIDPADLFDEAANRSNLAMAGFITDYGATKGQISLPKFSTANVSAAKIGLNVYFHDLMPATSIELYGVELTPVTVGTIDASMFPTGWHTVSFDIPDELLGREWICPTITSSFPGEDEEEYIIIDKYYLRPVVQHDMAVEAIYGTGNLTVAHETTFTAVIENRGEQQETLSDARFEISVDGTVAATRNIDRLTLSPGETAEAYFTFTPATDHIGNATLSCIISDSDDDTSNNTITTPLVIAKGEEQIVTDLTGSTGDTENDITLQWSPIGKTVGFQNMEKLSAFYYGKKLGEFTNYDGDGKNTFTINGFAFPGNGYAKAFQVFNFTKSKIESDAYQPYSGDQYLIAFCPDDEMTHADDYLISPAISGGSEISFMLNIITSKYGAETLDIMTSATDNAPESFTLLNSITKSTAGWEKVSENLPADARYFAIRYTSCNKFGIMIDDIDYIPESGLPTMTYNVYRNGTLIAEGITDTIYTDHDAPEGTNRYNVSVVIDGVEQPLSNTFTHATSGINAATGMPCISVATGNGMIAIHNHSGNVISIFSADGRAVATFPGAQQQARTHVSPGVYIISCGNSSIKVLVAN